MKYVRRQTDINLIRSLNCLSTHYVKILRRERFRQTKNIQYWPNMKYNAQKVESCYRLRDKLLLNNYYCSNKNSVHNVLSLPYNIKIWSWEWTIRHHVLALLSISLTAIKMNRKACLIFSIIDNSWTSAIVFLALYSMQQKDRSQH